MILQIFWYSTYAVKTTLLDKLHDDRDSLYKQVASFSLSSDNGNIEEHAASIVKAMKKWAMLQLSKIAKIDSNTISYHHRW